MGNRSGGRKSKGNKMESNSGGMKLEGKQIRDRKLDRQ
jgi:hypothetical protein